MVVTAIEFNADESSVTTIQKLSGETETIRARFIIDASGYGRVIPKLFKLDTPSSLLARKAVFAHMEDPNRYHYDEPNRITIVSYAPGIWVWIIPFSSGITSLGFVGEHNFFEKYGSDLDQQFKAMIEDNAFLKERFSSVKRIFEPRKLEGWSTKTEKFFGNGFVLTGNVTEFLDPVFSSGVMFATVSSHVGTKLVIRKLQGQKIDWQAEYTDVLQSGVDTFKAFVNGWYDGTLEKIFYHKEQNQEVKRQICSILAGYVWDQENPFVRNPESELTRLSKFISFQERMAAFDAKP
jgi:flavin-dependent dehydrogenase